MDTTRHEVSTLRNPAFDALRAGMMCLGIVVHAAMLYLAEPPPTMHVPTDANRSVVMNWTLDWIHGFRMPLFLVLSGWFSALMLSRIGLRGTLVNRAKRIGLPLLLSMLTVLPVTVSIFLLFWLSAYKGSTILLPSRADIQELLSHLQSKGMPANEMSWMHLWFLWFLCVYYLTLLPLAFKLQKPIADFFGRSGVWHSAWRQALVLTLLVIGPLWWFRGGQVNEGFMYMRPHLPSLAYFGVFFIFGVVAQRQPDAFSALGKNIGVRLALAIALFPVAEYLARSDEAATGTSFGLHAGSILANGFQTALWIGLLLGVALRWIKAPSPWITYLSRASFWVYLVHLPLVGIAGWILLSFDLPALVKFLLVCGFTSATALWVYHYAVQRSYLSILLNGRRFLMAWPGRPPT